MGQAEWLRQIPFLFHQHGFGPVLEELQRWSHDGNSKNIVDHKALQLISLRVAASSSNARRALEITSNAVGKVAKLLTDKKLGKEVK